MSNYSSCCRQREQKLTRTLNYLFTVHDFLSLRLSPTDPYPTKGITVDTLRSSGSTSSSTTFYDSWIGHTLGPVVGDFSSTLGVDYTMDTLYRLLCPFVSEKRKSETK